MKNEYMRIIAFLQRNEMRGANYNSVRMAQRKLLAMGYEKRGANVFISQPFISGRAEEKLNAIKNCATRDLSIMIAKIPENYFAESQLLFCRE